MNAFQQVPCWGVAVTVGLMTGLFYTDVLVEPPKVQPLCAIGHSYTENRTRLADRGAYRQLQLSFDRLALPPVPFPRPPEDGTRLTDSQFFYTNPGTCLANHPLVWLVTSAVRAGENQTPSHLDEVSDGGILPSILPGVWSTEKSCNTTCGAPNDTCPRSSPWITEQEEDIQQPSTGHQPLDAFTILSGVLVPVFILLRGGIPHHRLRRKPWRVHRAVPGYCRRQQHQRTVLWDSSLLQDVLPSRRDFMCQTVVAILLPGVWPSLLVWLLTAVWDLCTKTSKEHVIAAIDGDALLNIRSLQGYDGLPVTVRTPQPPNKTEPVSLIVQNSADFTPLQELAVVREHRSNPNDEKQPAATVQTDAEDTCSLQSRHVLECDDQVIILRTAQTMTKEDPDFTASVDPPPSIAQKSKQASRLKQAKHFPVRPAKAKEPRQRSRPMSDGGSSSFTPDFTMLEYKENPGKGVSWFVPLRKSKVLVSKSLLQSACSNENREGSWPPKSTRSSPKVKMQWFIPSQGTHVFIERSNQESVGNLAIHRGEVGHSREERNQGKRC
ncbi:uncharacterized protein LOC110988676 isoform X2 [Acanthaster planci]|uniref:Uncharacterized protein LOC110988676 isoform X2 n=1 Tax=Acanthaster planci TaxID=133434 RepID=A0A8B7ZX53_ACAPL|nr:uncharacterized protein LOC110988676 isoform X2 [Acanthaster planci]